MSVSRKSLVWLVGIPITFGLATSGCATKKFVRQQTEAVAQKVSQLETKTTTEIAALSAKHQSDIAQVDERIASAEGKTAEVARSAQQADTKAGEAMQLAQSNQTLISSNATQIAAIQKADKYNLVESGNVTFDFNKSELTAEAKAALDVIIQKVQATNRPVIELEGYTDETGSHRYNLALSRRRADAVARYLVANGVPLRGIRLLGRGEEQAPAELQAEFQAVAGNASASDLKMLARRVRFRLYTLGSTE